MNEGFGLFPVGGNDGEIHFRVEQVGQDPDTFRENVYVPRGGEPMMKPMEGFEPIRMVVAERSGNTHLQGFYIPEVVTAEELRAFLQNEADDWERKVVIDLNSADEDPDKAAIKQYPSWEELKKWAKT